MKTVIQRVSRAQVEIDSAITGEIGNGLLVLVGFEESDNTEDLEWMTGKILRLRIFPDTEGVMNLDISQTGGELLVVSQFTLHASTKKGNRPSYIKAARPETAIPLYEKFIELLQKEFQSKIQTGTFGADMKVSLINDGPVTIIIDSKNKE
jgi:D-tyrosyl-tRNA(Tyr) deacylase